MSKRYSPCDDNRICDFLGRMLIEPAENICTYAIVVITHDNRVLVTSTDKHDACVQSILIDGMAAINDEIRNREV